MGHGSRLSDVKAETASRPLRASDPYELADREGGAGWSRLVKENIFLLYTHYTWGPRDSLTSFEVEGNSNVTFCCCSPRLLLLLQPKATLLGEQKVCT